MRFSTRDWQRIGALLAARRQGFVARVQIAALDPAKDFVGADLRGVDFGDDNIGGFNFSGADLRGAKLDRALT